MLKVFKHKKVLAALSSICLLLTQSSSVYAASQSYSYDVMGNTTQLVGINAGAERVSHFSVELPKAVTFDGTGEVTDVSLPYTLRVTGAISPSEKIVVSPVAGCSLSNGGVSLPLTVTQTKTEWQPTEITEGNADSVTNGTIEVTGLQSGQWMGTLQFSMTLSDGHNWVAATCSSPRHCLGHDTDDDGVVDEACGITWGSPIGHSVPVGASFPYNCTNCGKTVYAITNEAQLKQFKNMLAAGTTFEGCSVTLENDIILDAATKWDPVVNSVFKGEFDGKNHTIHNYSALNPKDNAALYATATIASDKFQYQGTGFFNCIENAVVRNIKFQNYTLAVGATGNFYVSALVGTAINSTVENVHVTGNINSTNYSGFPISGICYQAKNTAIQNCSYVGTIATASNQAWDAGGGVLGYDYTYVSGICYIALSSNILNSYVAANLTSYNTRSGIYQKDYVVPIPSQSSTSKNCVYDKYLCVTSKVYTDTQARALTTAEMKQPETVQYLNENGTGAWTMDLETINRGYPITK